MIRAALATSILMASLFLLSLSLCQGRVGHDAESPQLIELRVEEATSIDQKTAATATPADENIALAANIEDLGTSKAQPGLEAVAQRWGGRPLLQRIRERNNPRRDDNSAAEFNQTPTQGTGKPIAAPPDPPVRKAPERKKADDLGNDDFGNWELIDPAALPRNRANGGSAPARAPKRSPLPVQPQPTASQSAAEPSETAGPSAANKYYDSDWYQPTQLNNSMVARRNRIRQCLDHYYRRPLNSQEHSPWSLMHTMIAWGSDSYIRAGSPRGQSVSTVKWLAQNGLSDGVRLLYVTKGQLKARTGPGLQGHDGQLLAMFAQTRVPADYPLRVENHDFTIRDLIEMEKQTCRGRMELTFKLIGLAHYLHPDDSWLSEDGSNWNIAKLIRAEIAAPINGVTCGGTHRLMGLNYAIRMRRRYGLPVDGQWARAEKYTSDYVNLAFQLQNGDGTFSTNFFRGKENRNDMERKVKTTGHILEWVVFAVPHERLRDRRITRAVDQLTNILMQNRYYDWPKGPIGHAIRALSLYNERVFDISPGTRRKAQVANQHVRPRRN